MPFVLFDTFVLWYIVLLVLRYFVKTFTNIKMSINKTDGSPNDDEIFFGKMTIREVKKRLFSDKLCSASATNSPRDHEDPNTSLKILQVHSEPNLLHDQVSPQPCTSAWDMTEEDSFLKLENMVARLCVSPNSPKGNTGNLNNTLEVIEYILNNPPSDINNLEVDTESEDQNVKSDLKTDSELMNDACLKKIQEISPQKQVKAENIRKKSPDPPKNTPAKLPQTCNRETPTFITPVNLKTKSIFKTPGQPLSHKKPATSAKKTPRSNNFGHITSPVASYINNCPIVPLVKDVHPRKPLLGASSIPKLKNPMTMKPSNKENINLPSVAYKSAVNTKVIDVPDEQKLPQCQWAKKMMTSLPRPMVMKHDSKDFNSAKRKLLPQQEDSFADLSCHQAEVSICTQKTAFRTNKN